MGYYGEPEGLQKRKSLDDATQEEWDGAAYQKRLDPKVQRDEHSYLEKKEAEFRRIMEKRLAELDKPYVTKDSGQRREFETGSVRDDRTGKGRYDLIPTYPLRRVAQLYERGAVKYAARNWEKGQPLMSYLDSAERHLVQVKDGYEDEDHEAAVVWNLLAYMWTKEMIRLGVLLAELDDRPRYGGRLMAEVCGGAALSTS